MERLLIKLMVLAALMQLGITLNDFYECRSRQCPSLIELASRDVLKINWLPISVWPEVAKRFRSTQ